MNFTANAYSVTTVLMIAFALFVIYTRLKNWLDSNVPIFFYVIMIIFMRSVEGNVPLWLILLSFALGLTLRFEFMNPFFTKTVKFLEIITLSVIIYITLMMVLH